MEFGLSKLASAVVESERLVDVVCEHAVNVSRVMSVAGFRSAFMVYLPYSETGGPYYGILAIQNRTGHLFY